jgi:small subunit ribosomal protein S6
MAQVQTETQKRVREYETIYVLRPDVTRESQEKVASRMEEVVSREGGKLTQVENWGRRQLAYVVKKYRRGVYVYFKYVGGGQAVSEVERNLRMLDDVLKYQTVQVRADLDAATLEVNAADVKFEAVEPPSEDEPDESIERLLGFIEAPERERSDESSGDDDMEFEGEAIPNLEDT